MANESLIKRAFVHFHCVIHLYDGLLSVFLRTGHAALGQVHTQAATLRSMAFESLRVMESLKLDFESLRL